MGRITLLILCHLAYNAILQNLIDKKSPLNFSVPSQKDKEN